MPRLASEKHGAGDPTWAHMGMKEGVPGKPVSGPKLVLSTQSLGLSMGLLRPRSVWMQRPETSWGRAVPLPAEDTEMKNKCEKEL